MPEMTEREQVLRDLVADLREECAEKDDKIEQQAADIAILSQKNPNGDRNQSRGDTCGRSCEGQAYRIEARTLKAEIEQANLLIEQQAKRIAELERLNLTFAQNEQQVEALRGFAQDIMECWPDCSGLDGGDLQDIAEKHGLLKPEQRSVPCGPDCNCAQITDLMPVTCYRKTKLLTGQ